MNMPTALLLGLCLSAPAFSQAAVIQYDLNDTTIAGKDCPLQISNLRISSDGRELTIDNSNWTVSLGAGGVLIDEATCLIRIPVTVSSYYQVLQVQQALSYSFGKSSDATIGIYGNAKLFDLADAPIDLKLGNSVSGTQYSLRQNSTANISNWSQWCRGSSQRGFLAINLGLSILRGNRNQSAWVQLGQRNSPYRVRLDAVSCQSSVDSFLGSIGDRQSRCEPHNRDGITCAGVGLHSPNAENCLWDSQWYCREDGCAGYKGVGDCA